MILCRVCKSAKLTFNVFSLHSFIGNQNQEILDVLLPDKFKLKLKIEIKMALSLVFKESEHN